MGKFFKAHFYVENIGTGEFGICWLDVCPFVFCQLSLTQLLLCVGCLYAELQWLCTRFLTHLYRKYWNKDQRAYNIVSLRVICWCVSFGIICDGSVISFGYSQPCTAFANRHIWLLWLQYLIDPDAESLWCAQGDATEITFHSFGRIPRPSFRRLVRVW